MFQLLNNEKQAVKSFKEGDNITFRIVVVNERNQERDLPHVIDLFSRDLFRVYASDGKDLGLPWDYMVPPAPIGITYFAPKGSLEVVCPWLDDGTPTKICGKETLKKPLVKGNYYTEFELTLEDNVKLKLRKDFTIE